MPPLIRLLDGIGYRICEPLPSSAGRL